MPISPRHFALALCLTLAGFVPAAPLQAQDAAPAAEACSVELFAPPALATAQISIERAAQSPEGEPAAEALRAAMRLLTNDRRFTTNPLGLAYARGQIYVLWMHQVSEPVTMTPADLGLGRDRTTQVDLAQMADSMLTIVETGAPGCASDIDRWRQSKPWNDRIAAAYRFLGQGALDSADYYAGKARQLDRRSPFLFNLLAQIEFRRGNPELALTHLLEALTRAEQDTSLAETTAQIRTQYAAMLQESAMLQSDTAKRNPVLRTAAGHFLRLAQDDPAGPNGPAFLSAALNIGMVMSDSTIVRSVIDPMVADPAPYPDLALLLGAETSRLQNRAADAMKLYEATLAKNPYNRDANYFLAFLYLEAKQPAKTNELLDRLLTLDPSNPDNLLMKTLAARQIADAEQDRTRRAALIREVEALSAREAAMQHRLEVTGFERRPEGALLEGRIENRGRAAKTYTVEFEFLDIAGTVVETMTATTESAAPNAFVTFSVTATKPGIAAYRYKPLS
jgi:tetratricopeptide (TPR) repeat protein